MLLEFRGWGMGGQSCTVPLWDLVGRGEKLRPGPTSMEWHVFGRNALQHPGVKEGRKGASVSAQWMEVRTTQKERADIVLFA